MKTKVISCNCKPGHSQDEIHGKSQRVHNQLKPKAGQPDQFRCTVCRSVK